MAGLTPENIKALSTGFKVMFNDTFNQTVSNAEKLAMIIPSRNLQETYAWIGAIPEMKKWIGDRTIKQLADYKYTIQNELYEGTVSVPAHYIEYDNTGVFAPAIKVMAEKAKKQGSKLVGELLNKGTTENCYDGTPFFGTHTVGDDTYSNKTNGVLNEANLMAAYQFMMDIRNENDEPMGIVPNLLVYGAGSFATARDLIDLDKSGSNACYKLVEHMVIPSIPAGKWYLLDTTQQIKAFILQIAKNGEFEKNEDDLFKKNEVYYGTKWFGNAGYGLWQLAFAGGQA